MQSAQEVRVVPLAPRPLCTPHSYDNSFQVRVQLDEPLWGLGAGPEMVAMEMMALCVQLDSLIVSSLQGRSRDEEEEEGRETESRRVSFERSLTTKATAVLQQMRELLRTKAQCGEKNFICGGEVEDYMRETGLNYLFPRVELYLQEPDQCLSSVNSPAMDGYFLCLSSLHNLLTMAEQMHSDAQTACSHKYMAHQLAILYQCVGYAGSSLVHYKKEIEGKFQEVKQSLIPSSGGHPPRLTPGLQEWLAGMTDRLVSDVGSLSPSLLPSLLPILQTLEGISKCN